MQELSREEVLGWIAEAVDGSIGMKVSQSTHWATVLAECKRFEDETGHRGRMSRAVYFGINSRAWDWGRVYFVGFELADMRGGPKDTSDKRKAFGTAGSLATYLWNRAFNA